MPGPGGLKLGEMYRTASDGPDWAVELARLLLQREPRTRLLVGLTAQGYRLAYRRDVGGATFRPVRKPREVNCGIPADLERIIMRAMARQPEDRYPDCGAMRADVAACLERLNIHPDE